jgi:hypothetical protein
LETRLQSLLRLTRKGKNQIFLESFPGMPPFEPLAGLPVYSGNTRTIAKLFTGQAQLFTEIHNFAKKG